MDRFPTCFRKPAQIIHPPLFPAANTQHFGCLYASVPFWPVAASWSPSWGKIACVSACVFQNQINSAGIELNSNQLVCSPTRPVSHALASCLDPYGPSLVQPHQPRPAHLATPPSFLPNSLTVVFDISSTFPLRQRNNASSNNASSTKRAYPLPCQSSDLASSTYLQAGHTAHKRYPAPTSLPSYPLGTALTVRPALKHRHTCHHVGRSSISIGAPRSAKAHVAR